MIAECRRITGNRHASDSLRLAADRQSFAAALPARNARGTFASTRTVKKFHPSGCRFSARRGARSCATRNCVSCSTTARSSTNSPARRRFATRQGQWSARWVPPSTSPSARRRGTGPPRRAARPPDWAARTGALFHDRLGHALTRTRRNGGRTAVMLLDLDQFKEVNDSLGHTAGDALLREVAARLRGLTRASDTWARLGGDEFALVQEGVTGLDAPGQMARRVLAVLEAPFVIEEQEIEVSASLGITTFPDHGDTAERLIRNADVALYRAKAAGRGRFEHYGREMDQRAAQGQEPAARPAARARRGRARPRLPAGIRATWPASGEGRGAACAGITPVAGRFRLRLSFPIAEASGLIHPMGDWVLRVTCRQAAIWRDAGRPLKVAVNVSAAQLRRAEFVELGPRRARRGGPGRRACSSSS